MDFCSYTASKQEQNSNYDSSSSNSLSTSTASAVTGRTLSQLAETWPAVDDHHAETTTTPQGRAVTMLPTDLGSATMGGIIPFVGSHAAFVASNVNCGLGHHGGGGGQQQDKWSAEVPASSSALQSVSLLQQPVQPWQQLLRSQQQQQKHQQQGHEALATFWQSMEQLPGCNSGSAEDSTRGLEGDAGPVEQRKLPTRQPGTQADGHLVPSHHRDDEQKAYLSLEGGDCKVMASTAEALAVAAGEQGSPAEVRMGGTDVQHSCAMLSVHEWEREESEEQELQQLRQLLIERDDDVMLMACDEESVRGGRKRGGVGGSGSMRGKTSALCLAEGGRRNAAAASAEDRGNGGLRVKGERVERSHLHSLGDGTATMSAATGEEGGDAGVRAAGSSSSASASLTAGQAAAEAAAEAGVRVHEMLRATAEALYRDVFSPESPGASSGGSHPSGDSTSGGHSGGSSGGGSDGGIGQGPGMHPSGPTEANRSRPCVALPSECGVATACGAVAGDTADGSSRGEVGSGSRNSGEIRFDLIGGLRRRALGAETARKAERDRLHIEREEDCVSASMVTSSPIPHEGDLLSLSERRREQGQRPSHPQPHASVPTHIHPLTHAPTHPQPGRQADSGTLTRAVPAVIDPPDVDPPPPLLRHQSVEAPNGGSKGCIFPQSLSAPSPSRGSPAMLTALHPFSDPALDSEGDVIMGQAATTGGSGSGNGSNPPGIAPNSPGASPFSIGMQMPVGAVAREDGAETTKPREARSRSRGTIGGRHHRTIDCKSLSVRRGSNTSHNPFLSPLQCSGPFSPASPHYWSNTAAPMSAVTTPTGGSRQGESGVVGGTTPGGGALISGGYSCLPSAHPGACRPSLHRCHTLSNGEILRHQVMWRLLQQQQRQRRRQQQREEEDDEERGTMDKGADEELAAAAARLLMSAGMQLTGGEQLSDAAEAFGRMGEFRVGEMDVSPMDVVAEGRRVNGGGQERGRIATGEGAPCSLAGTTPPPPLPSMNVCQHTGRVERVVSSLLPPGAQRDSPLLAGRDGRMDPPSRRREREERGGGGGVSAMGVRAAWGLEDRERGKGSDNRRSASPGARASDEPAPADAVRLHAMRYMNADESRMSGYSSAMQGMVDVAARGGGGSLNAARGLPAGAASAAAAAARAAALAACAAGGEAVAAYARVAAALANGTAGAAISAWEASAAGGPGGGRAAAVGAGVTDGTMVAGAAGAAALAGWGGGRILRAPGGAGAGSVARIAAATRGGGTGGGAGIAVRQAGAAAAARPPRSPLPGQQQQQQQAQAQPQSLEAFMCHVMTMQEEVEGQQEDGYREGEGNPGMVTRSRMTVDRGRVMGDVGVDVGPLHYSRDDGSGGTSSGSIHASSKQHILDDQRVRCVAAETSMNLPSDPTYGADAPVLVSSPQLPGNCPVPMSPMSQVNQHASLSPSLSPSSHLATPPPPLSPISPPNISATANEMLSASSIRPVVGGLPPFLSPPHNRPESPTTASPPLSSAVVSHTWVTGSQPFARQSKVTAAQASLGSLRAASLSLLMGSAALTPAPESAAAAASTSATPTAVLPGCHHEASLRCRSHGCRGKLQPQAQSSFQRGTGEHTEGHTYIRPHAVSALCPELGTASRQRQQVQRMRISVDSGVVDDGARGAMWQLRKQAASDSRDCRIHAGARGIFLLKSSRSDPYPPAFGRQTMEPGNADLHSGGRADHDVTVPAAGSNVLSTLEPMHHQNPALSHRGSGYGMPQYHERARVVTSACKSSLGGVASDFDGRTDNHTPILESMLNAKEVMLRSGGSEHPRTAGKRPRGIRGNSGGTDGSKDAILGGT